MIKRLHPYLFSLSRNPATLLTSLLSEPTELEHLVLHWHLSKAERELIAFLLRYRCDVVQF